MVLLPTAALLVAGSGLVWWKLTQSGARRTSSISSSPVQRNLTRLTFDQGLETDPTFSPDGRFIAYASDRGGNFDIWVQPIAGGDPVQVTKSPASDTQPSWSPDGNTIAFRSERDGGGLYRVPALGGVERSITNGGVHPSWSEDGSEVRFFSDNFVHGDAKLNAVSLHNGRRREILPMFTAGGSWLWIAARTDGAFSFLGGHHQLGVGFFTVAQDGQVTKSKIAHLPPDLAGVFAESLGLYDVRFSWNRNGTALFLEPDVRVKNLWKVVVDPGTLEWTSVERLTTGAGDDLAAALSTDGRYWFSALSVLRDGCGNFRSMRPGVAP